MSRKQLIRISALSLGAVLLLIVFTYLFFPLSKINAEIRQAMLNQGLVLTPEAHKTLLPGVAWDKPVISSQQGVLLNLDRFSMRLCLLPLFAGKVALGADARLGTGLVKMEYSLNARDAFLLSAENISLADLGFFKTALGGSAGGILWSKGSLVRSPKGLSGDVKLEITQLELAGIKPGGFALPDVSGLRAQGMVRIVENRAHLESLTLQGEGIYMRLSGDVPERLNSPLNMALEIMPQPAFLEKQKLVFMLLNRFMVSPGNFRIPIHGTLLKPEII